MTQINLLPWREEARKTKLIDFGIQLGIFIGITLFLFLLVHLYLDHLVAGQQARVTFLQSIIDQSESQLKKLNIKQKDEIALKEELQFFVFLRNKSFQAVNLLSKLKQAVPSEVVLDEFSRSGNLYSILGTAKTNSQITELMKNLNNLPNFGHPELVQIKQLGAKDFKIKMVQEQ
jgi:type IV pilus assembly protein PilN